MKSARRNPWTRPIPFRRVPIRLFVVAAAAAFTLVAASYSASAAPSGGAPAASSVRVKSFPHAVRLVVRFENTPLSATQVFMAGRPRALERAVPRVRVEIPGLAVLVQGASGAGVTVGLISQPLALVVAAAARPLRFKYLSYRVRQVP